MNNQVSDTGSDESYIILILNNISMAFVLSTDNYCFIEFEFCNFTDSVMMMGGYADVIVIRHPKHGAMTVSWTHFT
jgi:hypothetical protein